MCQKWWSHIILPLGTRMTKLTHSSGLIIGWIDFLFKTAVSVPSPKMTFLYQYNAPRLFHSTANCGHQSCFEHFRALLDVDWGYGSIIHYGDRVFLLYRRYTGCSCCNIGVIRKSLSGYLTSTSGTYSHTGVHNDQASYFNMKLLVFVELGHMQFF